MGPDLSGSRHEIRVGGLGVRLLYLNQPRRKHVRRNGARLLFRWNIVNVGTVTPQATLKTTFQQTAASESRRAVCQGTELILPGGAGTHRDSAEKESWN